MRKRVTTFLLLACSFLLIAPGSARAYYDLPPVDIVLSMSDAQVGSGSSLTIGVSVWPLQEEQLPGCGMTECPLACPPDCFDPNGWCVCGGTTYMTYYTQVSAVSSNNSVAQADYDDGALVVTGLSPGSATISIRASLAKHLDNVVYVYATVTGASGSSQYDDDADGPYPSSQAAVAPGQAQEQAANKTPMTLTPRTLSPKLNLTPRQAPAQTPAPPASEGGLTAGATADVATATEAEPESANEPKITAQGQSAAEPEIEPTQTAAALALAPLQAPEWGAAQAQEPGAATPPDTGPPVQAGSAEDISAPNTSSTGEGGAGKADINIGEGPPLREGVTRFTRQGGEAYTMLTLGMGGDVSEAFAQAAGRPGTLLIQKKNDVGNVIYSLQFAGAGMDPAVAYTGSMDGILDESLPEGYRADGPAMVLRFDDHSALPARARVMVAAARWLPEGMGGIHVYQIESGDGSLRQIAADAGVANGYIAFDLDATDNVILAAGPVTVAGTAKGSRAGVIVITGVCICAAAFAAYAARIRRGKAKETMTKGNTPPPGGLEGAGT